MLLLPEHKDLKRNIFRFNKSGYFCIAKFKRNSMSKLNALVTSLAFVSIIGFHLSFAAIATLVKTMGGFFIYAGFFPNSTPNISDLCLNRNFHFVHISSIKTKVLALAQPDYNQRSENLF